MATERDDTQHFAYHTRHKGQQRRSVRLGTTTGLGSKAGVQKASTHKIRKKKREKRVLEKVRHGPPSHDGMLRFAYGSRQLPGLSLAFLMQSGNGLLTGCITSAVQNKFSRTLFWGVTPYFRLGGRSPLKMFASGGRLLTKFSPPLSLHASKIPLFFTSSGSRQHAC